MQPEVYFTQISNLSEARFAASVMAKGIGFCIEKTHPDYVSPTALSGFKEWLVGSKWIAHVSKEPTADIKEIIEYFDFRIILHNNKLYNYTAEDEVISDANFITELTPLANNSDFKNAIANQPDSVLLFGSKEEEVGMASMDKWLDYFEELEIL